MSTMDTNEQQLYQIDFFYNSYRIDMITFTHELHSFIAFLMPTCRLNLNGMIFFVFWIAKWSLNVARSFALSGCPRYSIKLIEQDLGLDIFVLAVRGIQCLSFKEQ